MNEWAVLCGCGEIFDVFPDEQSARRAMEIWRIHGSGKPVLLHREVVVSDWEPVYEHAS